MKYFPFFLNSIIQSLHWSGVKLAATKLVVLLFLFLPFSLFAQSYDLTGYWQSDAGGCYQIRQSGNEVFWAGADNVFHGAVVGNTMTGLWYDLPSNSYKGFGASLSTRIENNNRIVKVAESTSYRGNVWTRINGPCGKTVTQDPGTGSNNTFIGQWNIKCCDNTLGWTLSITKQEGNLFSGSFSDEHGGGIITNGQLRGSTFEFDRINIAGWGKQHWSGQFVNEGGGIRIINGIWTGDYLDRHPGRNNWNGEKRK